MEKKEKNRNSYSELPEKEGALSTKTVKRDSRKSKETRDIRILKKCKSIKEKNDPERFCGEGINFRAKIIGIEDVFDARGNRMCQGALQKLKAAVKTSGDHKQRIILNISLDGIIIQDEKTGKVLHHHPIHKISCISQDTKDSRAFGFVYGCPQTGHRFFAIKTEKTASQVVVTLRDLFLVALEMKKKEIEKAIDTQKEERGEQESKEEEIEDASCNGLSNGNTAPTAYFAPTFESRNKSQRINPDFLYSNTVLLPEEVVPEKCELNHTEENGAEPEAAAEALLDLQSEVNILQQGISQMDQTIAHTVSQSKGFSFSEDEISESSVSSVPTSFQFKLDKLSSLYHETMSISSRSSSTSDYNVCPTENKMEENDTPKKDPFGIPASLTSESCPSDVSSLSVAGNGSVSGTSKTPHSTATLPVEDRYAVFLDIDSLPSIFDNPSIVKMPEEKGIIEFPSEAQNQETEVEDSEIKSSTPVPFAELDPLGNQPYIDKRDFFQDIKNPPKKVLKDLVGANVFCGSSDGETFSNSHECLTAFGDLKLNHLENPELIPPFADPPRLPPKRVSAASPFTIASDIFPESDFPNDAAWEPKNPFNPFLGEECLDMLPPSSPPPPPPPRLPSKLSESSLCMSSPPPRPPSRVNCVPTPPLPKRKVPLSSAQRTWFSFDQDASLIPAAPFPVESDYDVIAPPLPSPARKLPPSHPESSLLKSSSASNSPATVRRLYNKSSFLGNSVVIKENSGDSDSIENGTLGESKDPKLNTTIYSPHRLLTQHTSIMQEEEAFYTKSSFLGNATVIKVNSDIASHSIENDGAPCECRYLKSTVTTMGSPHRLLMQHSSIMQNEEACTGATFNPFLEFEESQKLPEESHSPPLPPKPVSICQPKPSSSVKKMSSTPCISSFSSSSVSVAESSNGTHSSSSLAFSSSDDNRFSSNSEALPFTNSTDSQSEVFAAQNSLYSQSSNGMTEDPDLSPDSIFRRKSDPFADDFFLTLHKKSKDNTQSISKKSSTIVEVPFNNLKAPT